MNCPNCGYELEGDSIFCYNCGTKLLDENRTEESDHSEGWNNQPTGSDMGKKICPHCQAAVPESVRVCVNCGIPFPEEDQEDGYRDWNNDYESDSYDDSDYYTHAEDQNIKRNRILQAVAGLFVLGLIAVAVYMFLDRNTINLNKYTQISIYGYNTVGHAEIYMDIDGIAETYGKKYGDDIYDITSYFDCSLNKSEKISNGDKVTLTWDVDEDALEKEFHCKVKFSDITKEAKDLEEVATFDPFENVEVSFSGVAPNGQAEYEVKEYNEDNPEPYYYFDNDSDLSEGDTVTLSIEYDSDMEDYYIDSYGKIPSETSKTYEVKGLQSYVKTLDQIPSDVLENMKAQADDAYKAYVADTFTEDETFKGMTYLGEYLLTIKEQNSWWNQNVLYLVYKINVQDVYQGQVANNAIYWYICYDDLTLNADGTMEVSYTDYSKPNHTAYCRVESGTYYSTFYYEGYETLNELYTAVVQYNLEEYNHEDHVSESGSSNQTIAQAGNSDVSDTTSKEETTAKGLVFEDSSSRKLTQEEVKALTDTELQTAINDIFAKNGYIFKDKKLLEYYSKYDWYKQEIKSDDFSMEKELNETEYANVEILQKEREARKK